jgi:hypothetical protein
MRHVVIGGDPSHIAALVKFSDEVLSAGTKFLEHMVADHKYRPNRFSVPPLSS